MITKTPLGLIIRQFRMENRMSQETFAKAAGISRGYLSMLEADAINNTNPKRTNYNYNTIKGCSEAMGMSEDELLNKLNLPIDENGYNSKNSPLTPSNFKKLSDDVLNKLSYYTKVMSYCANKLSSGAENDDATTAFDFFQLPDPSTQVIPVLGKVAAGIPILAQEEVIGKECINYIDSHTANYFGLKIKGKSMSPAIPEGSIVIVKQQDYADDGDIVIALVGDEEVTCKKYIVKAHDIVLAPLNYDFEPMYFTPEEVESKPVKILGKVVEIRIKY